MRGFPVLLPEYILRMYKTIVFSGDTYIVPDASVGSSLRIVHDVHQISSGKDRIGFYPGIFCSRPGADIQLGGGYHAYKKPFFFILFFGSVILLIINPQITVYLRVSYSIGFFLHSAAVGFDGICFSGRGVSLVSVDFVSGNTGYASHVGAVPEIDDGAGPGIAVLGAF